MLSGQDAFGAGVDQQHLRTPQGLVGRGLEAALPRDLPDHAGRSLWRGLGTLGISYFCRLGVLFWGRGTVFWNSSVASALGSWKNSSWTIAGTPVAHPSLQQSALVRSITYPIFPCYPNHCWSHLHHFPNSFWTPPSSFECPLALPCRFFKVLQRACLQQILGELQERPPQNHPVLGYSYVVLLDLTTKHWIIWLYIGFMGVYNCIYIYVHTYTHLFKKILNTFSWYEGPMQFLIPAGVLPESLWAADDELGAAPVFWFQNRPGSMMVYVSHEENTLFDGLICWDLYYPIYFYFSMADVGLSQNCRNMRNIPKFLPNISVFMADMMINHMIWGVQFWDNTPSIPSMCGLKPGQRWASNVGCNLRCGR